MDVKEVIKRLHELGFIVKRNPRGHYKVYDSTRWIFDVSATPSDPNWHHNIARNLRRMGLSLNKESEMPSAQVRLQPQIAATRERLEKFLQDNEADLKDMAKEYGEYSVRRQFSRLACKYADRTGIPSWKNISTGEQTIGRLLTQKEGARSYAINLINKTMDDYELNKKVDEEFPPKFEAGPEPAAETRHLPIEVDLTLRDRYANVLMKMLENGVSDPDALVQILDRLDKLVL